MGHVLLAQTMRTEQAVDQPLNAKNQGMLKTDGKEYSIFVFADSEAVTEAVSKFLQDINQQPIPEGFDFEFIFINQQLIQNEQEIAQLLYELEDPHQEGEKAEAHALNPEKQSDVKNQPQRNQQKNNPDNPKSAPKNEMVYTSLFSLARSFHATLSQNRPSHKNHSEQPIKKEESRPASLFELFSRSPEKPVISQSGREQQQDREKQQEKRDNQNFQEKEKEKDDKKRNQKKQVAVGKIKNVAAQSNHSQKDLSLNIEEPLQTAHSNASVPSRMVFQPHKLHASRAASSRKNAAHPEPVGSVDSIYIRFMALMARILGQAEYEAHQLYVRIKERTDSIDALTLLISKVNSEKGAIDWSNNEEMKQLIERARTIGVDIPKDKFIWSEEEKKLLKENIQMRKDSMEKMTQLERTDMQRFLQEASQCHQARSNVLKLLKEVIDTIIANMRP